MAKIIVQDTEITVLSYNDKDYCQAYTVMNTSSWHLVY